jgi:zinc/manganese transport system permease protein
MEWSILGPAFIAGLLVLATHVPLGIEVLKRGIIFIDLAIAQVAGLGALAAMLYWQDAHPLLVQGCSLAAALCGALFLTWTEKKFPDIQEALIGCLFVLAASSALLLLGQNPHGAEHMKDLLAGQILFVAPSHLISVAALYALLLATWFSLKDKIGRSGFYVIFAMAVTASVQLVGVYLVFASLIMPALAARKHRGRKQLTAGYLTGAMGLAAGLVVSSLCDLATGPTIVCALAFTGVAASLYKSQNKIIFSPVQKFGE